MTTPTLTVSAVASAGATITARAAASRVLCFVISLLPRRFAPVPGDVRCLGQVLPEIGPVANGGAPKAAAPDSCRRSARASAPRAPGSSRPRRPKRARATALDTLPGRATSTLRRMFRAVAMGCALDQRLIALVAAPSCSAPRIGEARITKRAKVALTAAVAAGPRRHEGANSDDEAPDRDARRVARRANRAARGGEGADATQRRAGAAPSGAALGADRQGVPLRNRPGERFARGPLPRSLATPRLPLHVRLRRPGHRRAPGAHRLLLGLRSL